MNEHEQVKQLGDKLFADGWRISSTKSGDGWDSWLRKPDVAGANYYGQGATCLEAMQAAVASRDAMKV